MLMRRTALSVAILVCFVTGARAAEPSPHFGPLKPMLGKTWKAPLPAAGSEKPKFDVQRWELALNGQAVRILHSIADGEYGGTQDLARGEWHDVAPLLKQPLLLPWEHQDAHRNDGHERDGAAIPL